MLMLLACYGHKIRLFLLYPTLAFTSMLAWQCDPLTGLLQEDYRKVCPEVFSFISVYSMAAFLLYPVGIPVFMNYVLRLNNISSIVTRRLNNANFDAMLASYIKRTCPLEAQRFARLVGNADDDPEEFRRQALNEFQKIIQQQRALGIHPEDGQEEALLLDKIIECKEQLQDTVGLNVPDLCKFMKAHDQNGDGNIDFDEFLAMIWETRRLANLFTGSEKPESLSDYQIETLLLYKWPEAHEAANMEDREGLGGLAQIAEKAHDAKEAESSASLSEEMRHAIEDRRTNVGVDGMLKPNFDRQDQQLVALADLVDRLKSLDSKGQLPSWYKAHDWRQEIQEALAVYVEDTHGRTTQEPNAPSEKLQTMLQAIQVRSMTSSQKLEALFKRGETLIKDGITAIPPLVWVHHESEGDNNDELSENNKIINRLGFLFISYRVEFWYVLPPTLPPFYLPSLLPSLPPSLPPSLRYLSLRYHIKRSTSMSQAQVHVYQRILDNIDSNWNAAK